MEAPMSGERPGYRLVPEQYFALFFSHRSSAQIAVWIAINYAWWVTPNLLPEADTFAIPIPEGTHVKWRALSGRELARYNLVNGTDLSIQDEVIATSDDVTCWQGEFYCTFRMTGSSLLLTYLGVDFMLDIDNCHQPILASQSHQRWIGTWSLLFM